jgi:hypothetical protein
LVKPSGCSRNSGNAVSRAFLVVTTAAERRGDGTHTRLITLTGNEFRRLFEAENAKPPPAPVTIEIRSTIMAAIYGCSTEPDPSLTYILRIPPK